MKKIFLIPALIAVFALVAYPASAAPDQAEARVFTLPEQAQQVAEGVYHLGNARDPHTGKKVEGIAFIHYKKGYHHRPDHVGGPPNKGGDDDNASSCYAYLSNGAKWNTEEPWLLNGSNSHELSPQFLLDNTASNIQKWEDAAGTNIFAEGSLTEEILVADEESPDKQNEVYFGEIDGDSAIAVTIVWGVFRGPPSQRGLVEWDQIYDDSSFSWNNDGSAGDMDFENISTHEIGHALGMGHPSDSCTEETMYRFASDGETKKRSLNDGDIAGIANLY